MKQNAIKVALVYVIFLLIAGLAVGRMVHLQFFDKEIKDDIYG